MLPYRGTSLIAHAVDTANDSDAGPVIVVLGAFADEVEKEIDQKKVHIAFNEEWEEGIGSSIRTGMLTLKRVALLSEAVILMVCDQPFIEASLLNRLIETQKNTGRPIVACRYENAIGTPALFHQQLFAELLELKGDKGARSIIEKYRSDTALVDFEKGIIDIDTEKDYEDLRSGV